MIADHNHTNIHSHTHDHTPANFGKAFFIGVILNTAFIIIEIIYGLHAKSLALLADAGHNASDVIGLLMAWGAFILTKRQVTEKYTYGLQSSSIIASMGNAVLLLIACLGIAFEAIQRFSIPTEPASDIMIIVALIGVLINGITAMFFMAERKNDLNIQAVFIHMIADAAISLGVVISGLIMLQTGWFWVDPLISILIALVIITSSWSLLKESFNLAVHATPKNIKISEVKSYLTQLEGVKEMHDLHIWALSTTTTALSVHLMMKNGHPGDDFIKHVTHKLQHDFKINHVTIQIEIGDTNARCNLMHKCEQL